MSQHPFSTDFDIYLDIDGVIKGVAAPDQDIHVFLEYLLDNFPGHLYWLTSYCGDGVNNSYRALQGVLPDNLLNRVCAQFDNPTWYTHKSDGIDFTRDFLWFDDNTFTTALAVLKQHGVASNFHLVDPSNPNSAKEMLQCVKDKAGSRSLNISKEDNNASL